MKVLAISDNVLPQLEKADFIREQYADADLIISCGDLPAPYLDFISSMLNRPLFYVKGNHDMNYEVSGPPGGDNLNQRVVRFRGMAFAGLEGCPRYNKDPVQYTETEMFRRVLGLAPRLLLRRWRYGYGLDVMVTHAPPRGIHDRNDRAHRGFRSFRLLITWYRPRYLLHGHVDTWDNRQPTVTDIDSTEVININPVKTLALERKTPDGS